MMKKAATVFIAIILVVSGMNLSIDRHFCSGNLVAVKLSVTGQHATCGMTQVSDDMAGPQSVNKKCCDDQFRELSISGNYYPEHFHIPQIFPAGSKILLPSPMITCGSLPVSFNPEKEPPPGSCPLFSLSQPQSCVFRI